MPINPYAPGKDDYTPPRKSAPPTLGVGVMLGLMVTIGANFGAYAMGLDPHNADISISTLVILTAIVAMITAAAVMTGDRPALGAVIMILAFTPYPVFYAAQALRRSHPSRERAVHSLPSRPWQPPPCARPVTPTSAR